MIISVKWFCGFFVGLIMPLPLVILAYSLAPMSLITPLSGISVILNLVLAPRMLGERLQPIPDVPAGVLILLGTAFTTVAGPRHDSDFSGAQLTELLGGAAFLLALAMLVVVVTACLCYMRCFAAQIEDSAKARPTNPVVFEVLLPAIVASCLGALVNIGLKAFGELVKSGAAFWYCFVWLLAAASFAIFQLNYVNRGLRLYMQTVYFPVYNSLLVVTNTFLGLIFYNEYEDLLEDVRRCLIFAFGIVVIVIGICMFRLRTSDMGFEHWMKHQQALLTFTNRRQKCNR